jgi:hypothetical protein
MSQHSASNPSGATAAGGDTSGSTGGSSGTKTAGIFDIRVIIGALLGLFGLILLLQSLFTDPKARVAKANEIDLNLWTGLALLATSAIFILWARLRPIIVEEPASSDSPDGH